MLRGSLTFLAVIAIEVKRSAIFDNKFSSCKITEVKNQQYSVYIMTNKNNTVLYVGVTNNLARRVLQHRKSDSRSFTHRYKVHKLVYYEVTPDIQAAIMREKQLKAGSRQKKIDLIDSLNPGWDDLLDSII